MISELRHEKTFAEFRRTNEQICAGIEQSVNDRRLSLEDALIKFLHRDCRKKRRIKHSQHFKLHIRKSFFGSFLKTLHSPLAFSFFLCYNYGEICIRINRQNGSTFAKMTGLLEPWEEMAQKYRNGEISREEYDQWRYRYPRSEAERNEAGRKAEKEDNNV